MARYGDESRFGGELPIGPTGSFPAGRLTPGDQGGLDAALVLDREKNVLVLDFGKPVAWVAIYRDEALALAEQIRAKALQLKP